MAPRVGMTYPNKVSDKIISILTKKGNKSKVQKPKNLKEHEEIKGTGMAMEKEHGNPSLHKHQGVKSPRYDTHGELFHHPN